MALFRKDNAKKKVENKAPVTPRKGYCRICAAEREMTDCWRRLRYVSECECCGLVFTDVGALYEAHQPACPDCQELLEQPGFEYGLCDECGSKFEIVGDMIPNLLPNRAQREEMDRRANS